MGRKSNYSFRLSDKAKEYITYSASFCGMSESKFLDFLLCSLSASDEAYQIYENEKAHSVNQLFDA